MYRPDPRDYQQLVEPITGRFDCGAWSAAFATEAHSKGKWKLTGRQIRLATDEPIPAKISPGLNLRQTDDAVVLLTDHEVDPDTDFDARWPRTMARIKEGRYAHLCVKRGPLVDAGFGGGEHFRDAHGVVAGFDSVKAKPFLFDPLVPFYQDVTWAALERAAGAFTSHVGRIVVAFTRVIAGPTVPPPRYSVKFRPQSFFAYSVNSALKITGREPRKFSKATSAPCAAPRWHNWPGHGGPLVEPDDTQDEVSMKRGGNRRLVQITAGSLKGLYVEPGASGITLVVTK
jgi:hypothetical protein